MRAMVLSGPGLPLELREIATPELQAHDVLIKVAVCAVCRTDLHLLDGELPDINYPVIPGHQVVGRVADAGKQAGLETGTLVGAAWLAGTCGQCGYCRNGQENLCDKARFNGYQCNGGYAEYMLADSRFVFPLPDGLPAAEIAPLLCGGLIGFRSLSMTGAARELGIYGFGSAAHMITQLAVFQGRRVYAFTREGDERAQRLATECGATWTGSATDRPPVELDAAIIFAPAGELVPMALTAVRKGGSVVCGGIHMSDIPTFPYANLWGERVLRSVANMTRQDGQDFLPLVAKAGIKPSVEILPLERANEALQKLREGDVQGTLVLQP